MGSLYANDMRIANEKIARLEAERDALAADVNRLGDIWLQCEGISALGILEPTKENVLAYFAAKEAEITRFKQERDSLYQTCIAAVNAIGGQAVEGVSIDFLSHLPEEITGKLAAVKAESSPFIPGCVVMTWDDLDRIKAKVRREEREKP